MNKEEILQKSREENKNKDIVGLAALQQASKIAYTVGLLMCVIICTVQCIVTETINWGCWVVDFSILSTIFLIKYIKLKQKHELMMCIIYIILTAFFMTGFIFSLIG